MHAREIKPTMLLTNLSKRERTLLYITVTAAVLALAYMFMLKPLNALTVKWNRLNQTIREKELKLKRNIQYIRQKQRVSSTYANYAPYLKKREADEKEITLLLNEVEKKASSSGIRIVNVRPRPVLNKEFYKEYQLELSCEATMDRYIDFIYQLQQSAQLIGVEKLELTAQSRGSPVLKAVFQVSKVLITD